RYALRYPHNPRHVTPSGAPRAPPLHFLLRSSFQAAQGLLQFIGLDHVANVDILEVFQVHPALSPERDLTNIVLETAQAGNAALVHDCAVAQQAGLSPTDQPSFADHAASHQPDARDSEDLTDLGTTQRLLTVGRLKQAFQRGPDVLDDFVDDIV